MSSLSDRHRSSFQAEYSPLSDSNPGWGSVALLPWDEAILGFPVADLHVSPEPPEVKDIPLFREALSKFCRQNGFELVSVRVTASDTALSTLLLQAGFCLRRLRVARHSSQTRTSFVTQDGLHSPAREPADHETICQICGNAFHFGRYRTDPHFPRELANRRYFQWVRRALSGSDPDDVVFVLGGPGKVMGFTHVVLYERNADLRLGAVAPRSSLGFWLYTETLRAVHALGARSVSTGISAANVRVMQIYSALGFRFSHPEVILHWHSPDSVRLIADPDASGAD